MFLFVTISLIAIFLAYLKGIGKCKYGFFIGFIIVAFFSAVKYNYGNDYWSYYYKFQDIAIAQNIKYILSDNLSSEPGWKLLNLLFKPLGFYWFVAVLSIFNIAVVWRLITKYVPREFVWFGLFVFLFSNAFFSVQQSMLRQTFAMDLVLLGFPYIMDRKWIKGAILLLLAITVHISASFCLSLLLIPFFNTSNKKRILISITCVGLIFMFAREYVAQFAIMFINTDDIFERYDAKYIEGTRYDTAVAKSLFGLLLALFPVIIQTYYIIKEKYKEEIIRFSYVAIMGVFLSFTSQIIPMTERLSWYFTIFSIVSLPYSFNIIKSKPIRLVLMLLFIAITLKEYYGFYTSDTWADLHYTYHSLFDLL